MGDGYDAPRQAATHAPNSAPHKRVKDAGSHTAAYSCRGYPRWELVLGESCTYGSVRGVRGNSHPYRETFLCIHAAPAHGSSWHLVSFTAVHKKLDAIGGTADIDWPPAPIASEAYDPSATLVVHRGNAFTADFSPYESTRLRR